MGDRSVSALSIEDAAGELRNIAARLEAGPPPATDELERMVRLAEAIHDGLGAQPDIPKVIARPLIDSDLHLFRAFLRPDLGQIVRSRVTGAQNKIQEIYTKNHDTPQEIADTALEPALLDLLSRCMDVLIPIRSVPTEPFPHDAIDPLLRAIASIGHARSSRRDFPRYAVARLGVILTFMAGHPRYVDDEYKAAIRRAFDRIYSAVSDVLSE